MGTKWQDIKNMEAERLFIIVSQTKPTGMRTLLNKNNLFLMKEGENLSPEPYASYLQELSYWILTKIFTFYIEM